MKLLRAKCKCGSILEIQIDGNKVTTTNCFYIYGCRQVKLLNGKAVSTSSSPTIFYPDSLWNSEHKVRFIYPSAYHLTEEVSLVKRLECWSCFTEKNLASFIEIKS